MAKFYGAVGFVMPMETAPDVYTETPVARYYMGDVIRNVKKELLEKALMTTLMLITRLALWLIRLLLRTSLP